MNDFNYYSIKSIVSDNISLRSSGIEVNKELNLQRLKCQTLSIHKYCSGEPDPNQPGHREPVYRVSRRPLGSQHLGAQSARHHRAHGAPRVAGGDLRPLPPPHHPQL